MSNMLLRVYPSDLKMPFELKKHNSACLELFNKTSRPMSGWLSRSRRRIQGSTRCALPPVSCRPGDPAASQLRCKRPRRFPRTTTARTSFLFRALLWRKGRRRRTLSLACKAPGKLVEEFKLRVVYVPANPPSPVPEETEEEDGSLDSDVDHEVGRPSTSNSDDPTSKLELESRYAEENKKMQKELAGAFQDDSVSKLELESRYAEENKKIQKELDLLRKIKASSPGGFSATFVLLVLLLSSLLGYLMFGSKA